VPISHWTLVATVAVAVSSASTNFLRAQTTAPAVKEEKPGLLAKAKIAADVAIASAQAKVPKGALAAAEIEQEGGKLIYSFDFKTPGKSGIDEVNIDAMTGKVLRVEHETPKAEAKERAADAKSKSKKPS
jgi:uncharacterized membrane protein YkoI